MQQGHTGEHPVLPAIKWQKGRVREGRAGAALRVAMHACAVRSHIVHKPLLPPSADYQGHHSLWLGKPASALWLLLLLLLLL